MKTIQVTRHGGPDVLQVVDAPKPTPGTGEILVKVGAAGINFADLMSRAGTYPMAPPPPFVPGFEVAGTVEAVGGGVTSPAVGTRVAAWIAGGGGYAEYAVVPAASAAPIPEGIDFAGATALLVQGLTAYFLLTLAPGFDVKGKTVLVSAASGGVGSLAVQIARLLGASSVVGLASTDAKREQVRALGAETAIDYTQPDWASAVKAATGGKGVDLYLDATGDTVNGGLKPLAPGGTWIIYGSQQGEHGGLSGQEVIGLAFGGQTLRGFSLYNVTPEQMGPALHQLFTWAVEGKLTLLTADRFPLTEAAQAHTAIAERRTTGKVVLVP